MRLLLHWPFMCSLDDAVYEDQFVRDIIKNFDGDV